MSLNIIIKKIHTYTGLQATLALLIFSIAVISLSMPGESDAEPGVLHSQYSGDLSVENIELARAIHSQVGLRFEASPKMWMISEPEEGYLQVRFKSPGARREVQLNKSNGEIEIKSWPLTVSQFSNYMHQESVGRRRLSDSLWLWAWSLYIEISLLALFALPVTGLYIWISSRSTKALWAKLSLVGSVAVMSLLWNLIR